MADLRDIGNRPERGLVVFQTLRAGVSARTGAGYPAASMAPRHPATDASPETVAARNVMTA
ncbi:MAG: hypothetical protein B7Z31_01205 [Rhodobacterales bacterium 12-65-15]|nr:MAG: hypothetical protein B7Z31_01205 [Rhodobacterales bacterium 12-65-15]